MNQDTYNLVSIIVSAATLILTGLGLIAVYYQIKKVRESIWSSTHSKLCDQSLEILKLFVEKPISYDYFYKCKKLEEGNKDRVFILYLAEALVNFLEHLILQKDALPQKQWEVWERFIFSTFSSSVVVIDFIRDNRSWYSSELLKMADEYELSTALLSENADGKET